MRLRSHLRTRSVRVALLPFTKQVKSNIKLIAANYVWMQPP